MEWQIGKGEDFMNKYKMITICSLTIVCVLILSLLLPLTTSANDKESIELKMHYENSSVTVDIAVNSEVYTGVVCKYIEVDNVLIYDNLSQQTQATGTTLNLNKTEDDKYTTKIENVSKRYVVIYVSIGNCDICDYIDCNLNTSQEASNNTSKNNSQEIEQNLTNQNNQVETQGIETTDDIETGEIDIVQQNNSNQSSESTNSDENSEEINTEDDINQNIETDNENESDDPIVVDSNNNVENTEEFQIIEEMIAETEANSNAQANEQTNSETQQNNLQVQNQTSSTQSNSNSNASEDDEQQSSNNTSNQIDLQNLDKDTINTDDFEEIQSVEKTVSTADTDMPQTGEDDFIKILGIVIFSAIAIISFYKYKKTK